MSSSRKPRKQYRPRVIDAAATFNAIEGASKLPQRQVTQAVAGMHTSLMHLQCHRAPELQVRVMGDMLNVSEQLADLGICSDDGSRAIITAAQITIATLCERHAATNSWAMRAEGIDTLRQAIDRHHIQLQHCSRREYEAALDAVARIVSQALAGNAGQRVIVIGHMDGTHGDWRTHRPATGETVSP